MTVNYLSGGPRKTRKRKPKKTQTEEVTPDSVSSQATEESNHVPGSDFANVSQSTASSLPSTPKRGRGQRGQAPKACLTSTPVHSSSTDILSPPASKQEELEYTELITQLKVIDPVFTDKYCFHRFFSLHGDML